MPRPNRGWHLFQKPNGYWCARLYVQRKTETISTHTKDRGEAERWLANFIAASESPTGQTLGEIIDSYVKARSPHVAHPKQLLVHAQLLKKFWQNKFVRDVEPMLTQCGNTRRDLETLKAALRFAYEKSWIESVPRISLPPKGQPRDRFLSTEQARLLIECSASAHLKLAILIMLGTGCRVGASLDLTWDRVDFKRDIIDFHNPEKMVTKKRRAVVPMSGTLKAALADAQQWATCGNVIEWKGEPVKTIKGSFKKAAARAGIPFCTPHTLKHTAISWMAEKFSVDQISDYTQTTPETVRRVYRKVNSSSLAPMADFLGQSLQVNRLATPKGGKLLSP